MMVWLVYPLTTIVPNYSAFRKRNRRLFNRELLRQARRRLATSSILAIVWPHVYATQSTDSGATWSPNVRMTSAQSNFDGNDNGPGDYSSSTPFNSAVWPFFSDHRNANPHALLRDQGKFPLAAHRKSDRRRACHGAGEHRKRVVG